MPEQLSESSLSAGKIRCDLIFADRILLFQELVLQRAKLGFDFRQKTQLGKRGKHFGFRSAFDDDCGWT